MNASEFNTELFKLVDRAVKDGVGQRKMSFETLVGIMEVHKGSVLDWRKQIAMQAAIEANQQKIIKP